MAAPKISLTTPTVKNKARVLTPISKCLSRAAGRQHFLLEQVCQPKTDARGAVCTLSWRRTTSP
ncbi:hypothetical protein Z949_3008 [Sulfitobacter guttiformis KCTC 32187]|nr:hypothetical protein Z949_3008 [Sulfitobacter guttiformis KCTC 32187]